jgi:uncharacterized membrane protein (DUF4010 family)
MAVDAAGLQPGIARTRTPSPAAGRQRRTHFAHLPAEPRVQDASPVLAPFAIAGRLGLAVAMAIVMGLAFEGVYKREERTSPGGIRTFPMLAVLGIVLYLLEPKSLLPYLGGLAGVALWLYAYIRSEAVRSTRSDLAESGLPRPGLMVPAANLLAYGLGPLALTQPPWIVIAAAVSAVLLLESRDVLHRWVREIPSDEVLTLGKFLILVGIILPLVPDRPVVQWTAITPFKAWLALVAVSALSYASYLLQRYSPKSGGALWPAVLGGAYSSTATTVALARQQGRLAAARAHVAAGIVVATAIMYLRLDAILALFNRQLAWVLLPALAASCALAAALAGLIWLRRPRDAASAPPPLPASNPLQLGAAVTFAALYVVLAAATSWVGRSFGQRGIDVLATITGFTDIDPFVLNLAQGSVGGMSLRAIAGAILIAASSNNVLKAAYALSFGGTRTMLRPALALLGLAAAGIGLALLYIFWR